MSDGWWVQRIRDRGSIYDDPPPFIPLDAEKNSDVVFAGFPLYGGPVGRQFMQYEHHPVKNPRTV